MLFLLFCYIDACTCHNSINGMKNFFLLSFWVGNFIFTKKLNRRFLNRTYRLCPMKSYLLGIIERAIRSISENYITVIFRYCTESV